MKKLPPPNFDAIDVFNLCNQKRKDPDLTDRMSSSQQEIRRCDEVFREAAQRATLHLLSPDYFELARVTKEEMVRTYENKMVDAKGPARIIYDQIITSSAMCPLCCVRDTGSLDHHLPKDKYPALAVNPFNLLPVCNPCNKSKLATLPQNIEEVPIHPYYDDLENEQWLTASLAEETPLLIEFVLIKPSAWIDSLFERLKSHFIRLRLHSLYTYYAGNELSAIRVRVDATSAEVEHRICERRVAAPGAQSKSSSAQRLASCYVRRVGRK
jgi:5-methylcytosine-specific restriction endonuclease McrA